MRGEICRLRARELMETFECIRTAVNGDKNIAEEYLERLRAQALGDVLHEKALVTIATNEELSLFLAGR